MPFTPYHFGPSAFIGLLFRRWIDLPVFILANIVVDVEVLMIWFFHLGFPRHRYCHTFLVGACVGLAFGLAAYPFRCLFAKGMNLLRIPYKTSFYKMIASGVLGIWLHVIIDGLCHLDVRMFWPSRYILVLKLQNYHGLNKMIHDIKLACLLFFVPAIVLYVAEAIIYTKDKSTAERPM